MKFINLVPSLTERAEHYDLESAAMNYYFPLGQEKSAIKSLVTLQKLYPRNKELLRRIEHLSSLGRR